MTVLMDAVLNDVVRAAVGIDKSNPVSAVGVNQIVDDEGIGISPGDGDAAVALKVK